MVKTFKIEITCWMEKKWEDIQNISQVGARGGSGSYIECLWGAGAG